MPKKAIFTVLFISWVVLITCLSLFKFSSDNGIDVPYLDKLAHFTFYFLFVVLGWLMMRHRNLTSDLFKDLLKLVVLAIGYGLVMEGLQHLLPVDRWAEFSDVLANTLGALMGALLIKTYFSRIKALK